jgi:hypothetical protein
VEYGVVDRHYETVGAALALDARKGARLGVHSGSQGRSGPRCTVCSPRR